MWSRRVGHECSGFSAVLDSGKPRRGVLDYCQGPLMRINTQYYNDETAGKSECGVLVNNVRALHLVSMSSLRRRSRGPEPEVREAQLPA